jgi:hypothetical protein
MCAQTALSSQQRRGCEIEGKEAFLQLLALAAERFHPHFALLLCQVQGFGGAVRTNEKLGVIIE